MQIRPLDPSEVELLVDELWVPLADRMADLSQYNALTDDVRKRALAFRREQVEVDDARTLVAVDDGRLVGYVSGEVQPSAPIFQSGDDLYVSEVYVREEFRRRGVAADLLDAIVAWGREQGCDTTSLDVDVANTAARAFYEDAGFQHTRATYRADL